MLNLEITSFFAATLAIFTIILAGLVVFHRLKSGHPFGEGDSERLRHAIRAHGNQIESLPIMICLMGLLEVGGADPTPLIILGLVYFFSRLSYAAYFHLRPVLGLRILGFWTSSIPILVASAALILGD